MMRGKLVVSLARKELLETLRDLRTLSVMILFPILLYPLIGLLSSQAQIVHRQKIRTTRYTIGVVGGELPPRISERLKKSNDLVQLKPNSDWKERLKNQKRFALVLDLRPTKKKQPRTNPRKGKANKKKKGTGSTAKSRQNEPPRKSAGPLPSTGDKVPPGGLTRKQRYKRLHLTFVYASTADHSQLVMSRVKKVLVNYQREEIRRRLRTHGLALRTVQPLVLKKRDVVTKTNKIRFLLSKLLPLLLILMTVMGAFYPAVDLTAGEKERGTLETLLTAPVTPLEIVSGKYIAVTFIAVLTGSLNLLSIWFTMSQGVRLAGRKMSFTFGVTGLDLLLMFGFLVLVALLASALMMAIASLARSFKEGQNYVTPAYLACLMPSILATLPGNQPTLASSLIPFTNITFAIQATIKGTLQPWYGVLTLLSMGLSIAFSLWLASKLFEQEQVLFRSESLSVSRLLLGNPSAERKTPNTAEAMFLIACLFLLMFYVGIPMQAKSLALGLGVTLWGLIFLPPLLFSLLRKLEVRETFRIKPFPWQLTPAVLLIAFGALPLLSGLVDFLGPLLFPNWKQFLESMQKIMSTRGIGVSGGWMFFLIALSPGICEEILFRGFLLSGLRKSMRPWPAILLTALLFAAFHFSVYRLIPTFLLGVMMGWLCVRSGSIFPAMMFHLTNNGLSLLLSLPSVRPYAAKISAGWAGGALSALAVVCLLLGIHQFLRHTRGHDTKEGGLFLGAH